MEKIKVVELFAGVGGFRLGLENSSNLFDIIFSNQWEPNKKNQWAFECYQAHFGKNENHSNEDVELIIDEIPNHDLLVGGFPCQDYSVARTQAQGIEGKKGVLWWSINKILKRNRPKFVLLENVDRLLKSPTKKRGRDFGIILKSFYDLGYGLEWRVINAADYGMMQKRRRVFIFAYHKTTKFYEKQRKTISLSESDIIYNSFFSNKFPASGINQKRVSNFDLAYFSKKDIVNVSDNFEFTFYNSGMMVDDKLITIDIVPSKEIPITLGELVENSVDKKYYLNGSLEKWKYLKGSKKIERINPVGKKYNYTEGKLSFPDLLDKPARTILTSESTLNRSTHVIKDQFGLRKLTPVEVERINGFPDNWTNTGMPERFRYFCMGNALVVPIVTKIGEEIIEKWKEEGESSSD